MSNTSSRNVPMIENELRTYCVGCKYMHAKLVAKYANEVPVMHTVTCKYMPKCERAYNLGIADAEVPKD